MLLVLFNSTRALAGVAAGQGATGAQLAAIRSAAGSASGSSPVSGRMVRIGISRATAIGAGTTSGTILAARAHARRGHRFHDRLSAPSPLADATWNCHWVGPRSRTVGPCAPLGRRRDRKCDLGCAVGPRDRKSVV